MTAKELTYFLSCLPRKKRHHTAVIYAIR